MVLNRIKFSYSRYLLSILLSVLIITFFFSTNVYGEGPNPKKIIVAGGEGFEPLFFLNTDGEPAGLYADLWGLWSEKTGVEVELRLMDWAETIPALLSGEVDAVDGVSYTTERTKFLEMTEPYSEIGTYVYFHESLGGVRGPEDLAGFPVGVLGGGHMEDYLRNMAPEIKPVPYINYEEIVNAAIEGRLRVFIGEDPTIPFFFAKIGKPIAFRRAEDPINIMDMRTAVRKGDLRLLSLIEQGHKAITTSQRQAIHDKWTGISLSSRIPWNWLVGGLVIVLAGLGLLFLWNTQLKKQIATATKTLREREERLRSFASALPDLAFIIDEDGRYLEVLTAEEDLLYKNQMELKNRLLSDVLPKETADKSLEMIEKTIKTERIQVFEYALDLPSGMHWFEARLSSMVGTPGEKKMVTFISRDITDRKNFEAALMDSENRYRTLFESARDGIYVHDVEGNILDVNEIQCERLGYTREEYLQLNIQDILKPEIVSLIKKRMEDLRTFKYMVLESLHIRKDGTNLPTESNSSVIEYKGKPAILEIIRDISERKKAGEEKARLEIQLQQAQKMEAIGTLAGGIAHDFNNLLMGIQGNASLLSLGIDPKFSEYGKLVERVKNIEQLVQSGSELTKQLLGFARRGKIEVKPLDPNTLVRESAQMFGRTKKEIAIHTKFQKGIWGVEADRVQIEQVLLNLYVNAWQSMPAGGVLYLETANTILEKRYVEPHQLEPGNYVKVSVTDNGIGMDEATRQRIFEPFFTTKEMGRGTGLGLASAYGIIKNHGGIIEVLSKKGEGATFNIYLPASAKQIIEEMELYDDIQKGTEKILIIDDEDMILEVGKGLLEQFGYSVITAASGIDGLEIYKAMMHEIDLVILDMIMPDMSGGETFDRLKSISPDIKVLLSSGYSLDGKATDILNRGCKGFIQKPFNLKELSRKIRTILANV